MLVIAQKVDAEERVMTLDLQCVRRVIRDMRITLRKNSMIRQIGLQPRLGLVQGTTRFVIFFRVMLPERSRQSKVLDALFW